MVFDYKITVFTPTYNRAYILEKLYRSLRRQTCREFEWLIIDDGSADNTGELVERWQEEDNDFPIRYYKVPNGGKHRAINRALDLAEGELFFTVDSDDYLTDDAVEKVLQWEKTLPREEKYCGFVGNLGTSPEETPNTPLPEPWLEGTALDRYSRVDGERAMVFYTEIHRKYRYPEFDGEKFITEAVTWNRMAHDGYKMRYFNDIIWIYEYQADGLTRAGNQLFLRNPKGYALWLREKSDFLGGGLRGRLRVYYSLTCELSGQYSLAEIAACAGTSRLLVALLLLLHRVKRLVRKK